jgi:hypothetical protein
MYTDKTDSLKQKTPVFSYPCWSCHPWSKISKTQFVHVRCAPIVVKILFLPAEEEIEPRITRTKDKDF